VLQEQLVSPDYQKTEEKIETFFFSIQLNKVVVRLKYWCSILSLISLILVRKKLLLKTGQTSPVSDFDESKVMVYLHQVENNLYYAKLVCITEICKVLRC